MTNSYIMYIGSCQLTKTDRQRDSLYIFYWFTVHRCKTSSFHFSSESKWKQITSRSLLDSCCLLGLDSGYFFSEGCTV